MSKGRARVAPHSDMAHRAITAELVRLTLPHRDAGRPELEHWIPARHYLHIPKEPT